MKVLMMSYIPNGEDVGEAYVAYRWIKEIAKHVELTVLCFEPRDATPLREQIPGVEFVSWQEPYYPAALERFRSALKPAYPILYRNAKRWLQHQRNTGRTFDIAHHFMPLAPRYPSPFHSAGIPYIMGPVGGTLPTPPGFEQDVKTGSWYLKLRNLDGFRFKYDPWLRRSYKNASLVMGVAPYVADRLEPIGVNRFEAMLELSIDTLAPPRSSRQDGELRLLHIGRGVRTKGLRDVIRAMAQLNDLPNIKLVSAGFGEEIEFAKKEVIDLGLTDRVSFLGKISRARVEQLYETSDIFVFPSFREPTGGVFFEAMRWGLPTIAVDYGGPAYIHNDQTAIKLSASSPTVLAQNIAEAIRKLHQSANLRTRMGDAAKERVAQLGLWEHKSKQILELYESVKR